jgi:ubiquinone/menaquinone biosynthesis C-methylase UbiE
MKKKPMPKQPEQIELLDLAKIDLTQPLPYADGSVKEILCAHKFEYIPGKQRVAFMEEAYRVLEVGGKMTVIACYWTSPRAVQDPALEWPPICEQSFLYFNKGWREANKLPPIKVDMDFSYGYAADQETAGRNQETQAFWIKHYLNTVLDVQVVLVKRAMS